MLVVHPPPAPSATPASAAGALSVLKKRYLWSTLTFNGVLSERDERNPGTVPYQTARHSGDAGCFAMGYRKGGYYLLFLKRGDHPAYA